MKLPARALKWLGERPRLAVLLFVLYTLLIGASGWVMPFIKPSDLNCSPNVSCPDNLGTGDEQDKENICRVEEFSSGKRGWDTSRFRKEEDGFYCPREDWEDPVMWYEKGITPGFELIWLEYSIIKDKKITTANPPSLVFAMGNQTPVFKGWTPEGENLQLFRFSSNPDLDRKILVDDLPETLTDPVKLYQKDVFYVEKNQILPNGEVLLNFNLEYISKLTNTREEEAFPKRIRMPVTSPDSSQERIPFGIGTFVGNCIKLEIYRICER